MMPGMDMKKIKQLMKDVENIPAERVIIEGEQRIIIENPQIMKMNVMGKTTFQIMGEERVEEAKVEISETDVHLVMEKTGKDEDEVREKLEENDGDIAKTIMDLSD